MVEKMTSHLSIPIVIIWYVESRRGRKIKFAASRYTGLSKVNQSLLASGSMEIARSSSSTNHDLSVTIFKSEDLEVKSIIDWRKMTGQNVSRLQSLWLLEEWVWRVVSILCDLLHEAFAYQHLRPIKKTTLALLKNASNSDKDLSYVFPSWEENSQTEEIFNRLKGTFRFN